MIYLDISQGFISNQKKTVDVTLLSFFDLGSTPNSLDNFAFDSLLLACNLKKLLIIALKNSFLIIY